MSYFKDDKKIYYVLYCCDYLYGYCFTYDGVYSLYLDC